MVQALSSRLTISVYEYDILRIGHQGFKESHWKALLKLNELNNGAYFSVLYNGIKFTQFVGVIQVEDIVIEILPKINKSDDKTDWREVLIQMLKACKKLSPNTYGNAHVKKQNLSLLDLYFDSYLNEVSQLIKSGLIKKYRAQSGNIKVLKGRLNFAQHIKENLVHKERFNTTHQVYDTVHDLHFILNEALLVVDQMTKGAFLQDKCKRTLFSFPELERKKVSIQLLNSIKLNRKTEPYARALELARLILLNYSPDIAGGREKMLALLFDMNKLWEEYILRSLQKYKVEGVKISGQRQKMFWSSDSPKMSKVLRPDIAIEKDGQTFIIDTKWKLPQNGRPSDDDLKQIYVYNKLWNAKRGILLYPQAIKDTANISGAYNSGNDILETTQTGEMHFVSVLDCENKLRDDLGDVLLGEILRLY